MLERARERERTAPSATRRRPKQLTDAPALLTAEDGAGLAVRGAPRPREDRRPGGATAFGEEQGEVEHAEPARAAARAEVHRIARAIAARLSLDPVAERRTRRGGAGELRSVAYRDDLADLDLDRTLDVLAERRPLAAEEIVVRERRRAPRAIVLLVDVSGSMRGERLHAPAAAVGALVAELSRDLLAVVAFASDASRLLSLGETASLEQIIDSLLALDPTGLTNVGFPLEVAAGELERAGPRERRVVLLSDCVHNAGPDPRPLAARLPRLDVLFDASAECDVALARDLAQAGRGRVATIRHHREVAAGLHRIFER